MTDITISTVYSSLFVWRTPSTLPNITPLYSPVLAPELPQYIQDLIPYDERNLALKALREVQKYTGCKAGAAIHLMKRVPAAAGRWRWQRRCSSDATRPQ